MLIYIAGRIAGLERDDWTSRFGIASLRIRAEGNIPINPAVLGPGWPSKAYMPVCLAMLNNADAIYMLENWEGSPGAKLEKQYAEYQGLRVLYQESHEADRMFLGRFYIGAAEDGYRKFEEVAKKAPGNEVHWEPAGASKLTEDGVMLQWNPDK